MSTLTKILIVLLTLSSIFLCGIVVTYVANADDYRQQNTALSDNLRTERAKSRNTASLLEGKKNQCQNLENKLNNEIASLRTQIRKVNTDLTNAEREKAKLLQDYTNMASVVQTSAQTAQQQTQLFENAQQQLKTVKDEQIKERKELDDIAATLNEKMAIITMLEDDIRRLQQEKVGLQGKLDKFLRDFGKEPVAPVVVTPPRATARPVTALPPPADKKIDLKALVTLVDLKNSVAEISIGSAEGVRKDMKFYVTRGNEFICEIWIHYVDADRAVGDLKLVQRQPKTGDSVTTSL